MEGPRRGTLFVVATPIGNLEDITLRALRVLREVALVAAEDTRRTGQLLRHYQIATPQISLHAHNERDRVERVLARLDAGDSVALTSDAGTPGISDPGAHLVWSARQRGLRVEPVPGPSAVTAALSASGTSGDRFVFAGFPPVRSKDRTDWFEWVRQHADVPVLCFEAPHRIARTLREGASIFGNRPILLGREVTKAHETWLAGTASDVSAALGEAVRGEIVFILEPVIAEASPVAVTDAEIQVEYGQITKTKPATRRQAIKLTAARLAISAKTVYRALERGKNSGK